MVEQDVAPAGVASLATRSGGAGAPPGDTRVPCQELADGRGPVDLGQKARPDAEKCRDGAPRGAAHPGRCAHLLKGCAARCSIPSAFEGDEMGRRPARGLKEYGR